MAPVGRGDGPAQILFLEEGFRAAAQIDVQERLYAGRRRSGNPNGAAVGGPIEAGDTGPILQREDSILAVGDGKKANVGGSGNVVFLGHGESQAVGAKRRVLHMRGGAFDPRKDELVSVARRTLFFSEKESARMRGRLGIVEARRKDAPLASASGAYLGDRGKRNRHDCLC